MTGMPVYLSADHWILHLFSSQAAREGGVIRRKLRDVERFVGREVFLAEMQRRGFPVIENAGQFVIFCNREPIRRLASSDFFEEIGPEPLKAPDRSFPKLRWPGPRQRARVRGMTTRPEKHSLTLKGHRTSVSLEPEFWAAFRAIAAERSLPLNELASEIDIARRGEQGLATAIRVFCLEHYRQRR
ncbi:hypothetical protein MASR1M32_19870 [Rhodobacter sp.]